MRREPSAKEKAYSRLTIKQIDEDQRIITGIASTPTPDRVGDIVESEGVDYELPLPFLKHHDCECPIGQVLKAKVTAAGIEIVAQVFKVLEPASLVDRLDQAWAEIKSGLIRGLSIGFQPVEYSWMEDTGGIRFIRWLWLELSAVTIPANQDATIQTIKSYEVLNRKAATSFSDLPIENDRQAAWEAAAADQRVRNWASSDGSGAADKMDWKKYAKAFFWQADGAQNFGDFKLGFADVKNGTLTAIPRGIFAVAAVLQGSRGGVDLPAGDEAGVKDHVARYYAKMRRVFNDDTIVAPWEKESSLTIGQRKGASARLAFATKALPGASGSSATSTKGSVMKKPIAEQIKQWETTLAAKTTQRNEIMEKSAEAGTTLNKEQKEEYDTLSAEITDITEHLARLKEQEKAVAASAQPVAGQNADDGAASRGHRVISVSEPALPKGIEFARYAMCLATAKGNAAIAYEVAKARFPNMARVHEVLKAAVAAGTTTDPAWAGSLVQYIQFAGDFVEFLRPQTIIGRFGNNGIPALRQVPFNVMIKGQSSGANGYWVGQGKPKPLTKFDVDTQTLRWAKVANIAVITEELARFSTPSAEALVRDELARSIVERLDIDFIDPAKAAVADVSPASITNGLTPVHSSGTDAHAIEVDVNAVFNKFVEANLNLATGVWIMSASTALALTMIKNALGQRIYPEMTLQGGTFYGLPVIVSQYAALDGSPGNAVVVLLNASDIWLADDGQVVIDVSREASLEMSDSPTNASAAGSPEAPVPTQVVSLWQTNSIGIKAERFINWARRRPTAVAYIDRVNWAGTSASPA